MKVIEVKGEIKIKGETVIHKILEKAEIISVNSNSNANVYNFIESTKIGKVIYFTV